MSKKEKVKMTKDIVPEDFTMGLALVDAIPVLFFCATMVLVGILFQNVFFLLGASMVLFAGAVKVLWKVIVVKKKRNIWWMFLQMRILMPIGMVLMIASCIMDFGRINGHAVWAAVSSMPSALCFLIGIIGMILMTIFAFTLDSSDLRSNWIEQITNGIAQAAIFLGVMFILF